MGSSPLLLLPLLCAVVITVAALFLPSSSASEAYPSAYSTGSCRSKPELIPVKREIYAEGHIIDITHPYTPNQPTFGSDEGIGEVVWLEKSMKNGSITNNSFMKMPTHCGTHVDAPGHVFDHYFDAGFDVETLDLEVLNGPALLVDAPRDKNITAEAMESLQIPRGVRRVLFRTLNTDRKLMYTKVFASDYTAFTEDGAKWLVENTDIKLVGIDYVSAATYDHIVSAHLPFLEGREVILVESLKLDDVPAGMYNVHCLHLRLPGAEGAPIRCILIK